MKLNMVINKIKSIDKLEIDLPIEKGLYAITGQNGAGKSTVVTCASTVFFNMKMKEYLGFTDEDASILFNLNGSLRGWKKKDGKWKKESQGSMLIKGFYEGSIIFGNRFRNTSYKLLSQLDMIDDSKLKTASDFIRENLGKILHNNQNFYEHLYKINNTDAGVHIEFSGDIFYYQKNNKRVSQFHMSTGENLLISILNSINIRNSDRANLDKPCLLFLDEIELALHPSSLKRLVSFLKQMSDQYNYAIYFSTHSIELISSISPENIFFLERHSDNSVEILNPCYPAYATRILYDHQGYDYIILVEDDLAKEIVNRLLRKHSLLANRLVHVLPCGGYLNVIELAKEVVNSNLVGKTSSISMILDGDIKAEAEAYIIKSGIKNNIAKNYLPIESLEKYLKTNLHDDVDHKLFRTLNDFIFHQVSLTQIIDDYKTNTDVSKDKNGKKLYKLIDSELRERGKSRSDIVEIVVEYLLENKHNEISKIVNFLKSLFV
ncbi:ATP-dependent nuclease [Planktothrix agardhii]|uniref:ATPase AAA-type core domain-containing protein n=2 Tax=Planktothrix agardhii TaxID=1160 RepID=A0A073CLV5_PLAA1|nr:AAA family ATPase [Planktothrix agardhii]KEI69131.1 hypothetical protein A19Y_4487 [Planktothrix agardhii NIVA-CYA 126/8]CAD5910032.1 hypothetical protein NIVACYA_00272 [Planktothrix agardhii]